MENVSIFENEEFGSVRTVLIDEKPYFVANDIATALGYSNQRDAIRKHCKGVKKAAIQTSGGIHTLNVIPESDVFLIITKSANTSEKKKSDIIKWLNDCGFLNSVSLYSRKEIEFIDELKDSLMPFGINGETQYSIDNYNIDYYIPDLNLAIEYDENDHLGYGYEAQEGRENKIKKLLNCKFIRLSDRNTNAYNIGVVLKEILCIKNMLFDTTFAWLSE